MKVNLNVSLCVERDKRIQSKRTTPVLSAEENVAVPSVHQTRSQKGVSSVQRMLPLVAFCALPLLLLCPAKWSKPFFNRTPVGWVLELDRQPHSRLSTVEWLYRGVDQTFGRECARPHYDDVRSTPSLSQHPSRWQLRSARVQFGPKTEVEF